MHSLSKTKEIKKTSKHSKAYRHTVVGAGVTGIQMVLIFLDQGVKPKDILWIDEDFNSGAFGRQLLGIAGNTAVGKYQDVFRKMFAVLRKFNVTVNEDEFAIFKPTYAEMFAELKKQNITLNETEEQIVCKYPNIKDYCCSLSMVTPVLQFMTEKLRGIVPSVKAKVKDIDKAKDKLKKNILCSTSEGDVYFQSLTATIANGAKPKTVKDLEGYKPPTVDREIPPWTALSMPDLEKYLRDHSEIKSIAIMNGWSHSGALILKNILFISDKLESEGRPRVKVTMIASDYPKFRYTDPVTGEIVHNNNGLSGDSAHLVLGMIMDPAISAKYEGQWQSKILEGRIFYHDVPDEEGVAIVAAFGFKPSNIITVNGKNLSSFIEAHPNGGSFKEGIFTAGFTSPIKDDENAPIVGITKVWDITQRVAQLAIGAANLVEERADSVKLFSSEAAFFANRSVANGIQSLGAKGIPISRQVRGPELPRAKL